ncbi:hypothetical protein CPB86DRAFT_793183 [Serendipita vermifera]|nr:hypothetical protein CPB86DRAFT_793183 [Serendipita vermifera]
MSLCLEEIDSVRFDAANTQSRELGDLPVRVTAPLGTMKGPNLVVSILATFGECPSPEYLMALAAWMTFCGRGLIRDECSRWWDSRWDYWGHKDSGGGNRVNHSGKVGFCLPERHTAQELGGNEGRGRAMVVEPGPESAASNNYDVSPATTTMSLQRRGIHRGLAGFLIFIRALKRVLRADGSGAAVSSEPKTRVGLNGFVAPNLFENTA